MTNASTVIQKSPRKARLIIDSIRGMNVENALDALRTMNKEKTKKIYDLIKSAAHNLKISDNEYSQYIVKTIVAEEAQRLYRVVPRAKGSAFRIRRRYSRIKVALERST